MIFQSTTRLNFSAHDLSKQPGVIGVAGGEVIDENGVPTLTFASQEDEKAFAKSDWAQKLNEKARAKAGPGAVEPRIGKFLTSDFPANKPKAYMQFSFLKLANEGNHEEAKHAWLDLVAALGRSPHFDGRSVGDGPSDVSEAFAKPESQGMIQKYHSFGNVVGVLVKLEV
ncbi:hypothetical protein CCHL11_02382 [Colletotrichum chlorophyti]|uniref:Uncharacterized protein n=1 Tax=Colletotrichum chlorophyti TaxID=708187 RepID=A0A1Q8S5Q7_9PEZI|nr:hypothetical protein CCHL11_02382 [Colletotrichum chlorophyti]